MHPPSLADPHQERFSPRKSLFLRKNVEKSHFPVQKFAQMPKL
jgi:hypothetical protein